MNKKQVLTCILVSLLVMMAVPAVLAHTHIELPDDGCQNVPGADTDQDTGSHFGMGVAKGSEWGSRSTPPGNSGLEDYPGDADAVPLEGDWCD